MEKVGVPVPLGAAAPAVLVQSVPWALDSGGFRQVQDYGQWTVTSREYIARVRRYRDEAGSFSGPLMRTRTTSPLQPDEAGG
jgi:hypothetical protein